MNMDELLERWRNGTATDADLRELTAGLATPEHRDALLEDWLVESALPRALPAALVADQRESAMTSDTKPSPRAEPKRWSGWLQWRPLMAAAAGIVFGIFCTSMVFGFSPLGRRQEVKRLFPLKNGSFEDGLGALLANPPANFGLWTGDASEVVAETLEAKPKSGKRMLRFVSAEALPANSRGIASRCSVYQLIDLRPIWEQVGKDDEVTLKLRVSFLGARSVTGESGGFQCRLLINPGSPELVRDGWPKTKAEGCAYARTDLANEPDMLGQWRTVEAKVLLPRNAVVAAVHLSAFRLAQSPSSDTEFGHCYADDVTVTVSSRSPIPKD